MSAIIAAIAGALAGTSGLVPFIHINTLLQASALLFQTLSSPLMLCLFAIALSFSHAVFEIIPAVFFAVPSATQVISVLPAQKLARQGKGIAAVKLMLYSLTAGAFFAFLAAPAAALLLPPAYELLKPFTGIALAAILVFLILKENQSKFAAIAIIALSGALGLVVLRMVPAISMGETALFPLLTGLFALPALLASVRALQLPKQENAGVKINWSLIIIGSLLGVCSGLLPALSPAIIAGLAFVLLENKNESFLTLASAIAGSKLVGDLIIFAFIGKARSGMTAIIDVNIGVLTSIQTIFFFLVAIVALSAATAILLFSYPRIVRFFCGKGYARLQKIFLLALAVMLFCFGGPIALFIAGIACCVGLVPVMLNMRRSLCCAALIVPALAFFI